MIRPIRWSSACGRIVQISLAGKTRRALGFARRQALFRLGVGRDDPVVLMYHRIASPPFDPWGLCVSPENFREQLLALKADRPIMAMDDLVGAIEAGRVPPRAVALTFDDGYADNVTHAKPILEELQIPATIFVTTAFIGEARPFWWDELAALVLGAIGAAEVDCEVAGVRFQARWPAQETLPPDLAHWRAHHRASDPRRQAYVRWWQALQAKAAADRDRAMAELRLRLGDVERPPTDIGAPMTEAQVRELPSALLSLGGHGRTHAPLTQLPPAEREYEIVGGRSELTELSGQAPHGFAYPHGEWDAATREAVIRAGYSWAVTTRAAKVDVRRADKFALPRVKIMDWSGPAALRAMRSGI